jgi:hypothetical protein
MARVLTIGQNGMRASAIKRERVQMTIGDMTPTTIEKLWEIVRAVADSDCTYYDDLDIYCIFQCDGQDDYKGHFTHAENCPSMKARVLVKEQS